MQKPNSTQIYEQINKPHRRRILQIYPLDEQTTKERSVRRDQKSGSSNVQNKLKWHFPSNNSG